MTMNWIKDNTDIWQVPVLECFQYFPQPDMLICERTEQVLALAMFPKFQNLIKSNF
jgi:hypothetical protein